MNKKLLFMAMAFSLSLATTSCSGDDEANGGEVTDNGGSSGNQGALLRH